MKFFIYILYSPKSNRYYVGYTHDIEARLHDHNHGDRPNQSTKYTFKHRPWELKCAFVVGQTRAEAMRVERYIKRHKSRIFIEKLIAAAGNEEEITQLVRVPTRRD